MPTEHDIAAERMPPQSNEAEMGVIGSEGMVQTRLSRDEVWQLKRGNTSADPIVHSLPGKKVGWGAHHGFLEVHGAFFDAVRTGNRALTDVRDCVDGTLLAIAAEEAIAKGEVIRLQ